MPKTRVLSTFYYFPGGGGGAFSGNLHLGIVSLGFGLQVEGGGVKASGFRLMGALNLV